MPWRLIQFIIIFGIFLVFAALNLVNKSDINFGFTSIKDVPVYLSAFSAFIFGMLCSLPFIFRIRSKKKNAAEGGAADEKPKKRWGKKKETPEVLPDSSFSDGGPYGVN
jgi:uncharacterized integral membrane protein